MVTGGLGRHAPLSGTPKTLYLLHVGADNRHPWTEIDDAMEANSTTNLDMRAFVHVVEHQSFAAAAKALELTRPPYQNW